MSGMDADRRGGGGAGVKFLTPPDEPDGFLPPSLPPPPHLNLGDL